MMVWRVEDENGKGPYVGKDRFPRDSPAWALMLELANKHSFTSDHPAMWDIEMGPMGVAEIADHYVFGFPSLNKAVEWFEGYIERLIDNGFSFNAYEVPEDLVLFSTSRRQLMFKKSLP